jgi:hypothetical protein
VKGGLIVSLQPHFTFNLAFKQELTQQSFRESTLLLYPLQLQPFGHFSQGMCFFFEARCLCCDATFIENIIHCHHYNTDVHICEKNHTIDGWPVDIPMNYDVSIPGFNLHNVLQEWSICFPCLCVGQQRYLPEWMAGLYGQRTMFRYLQ